MTARQALQTTALTLLFAAISTGASYALFIASGGVDSCLTRWVITDHSLACPSGIRSIVSFWVALGIGVAVVPSWRLLRCGRTTKLAMSLALPLILGTALLFGRLQHAGLLQAAWAAFQFCAPSLAALVVVAIVSRSYEPVRSEPAPPPNAA